MMLSISTWLFFYTLTDTNASIFMHSEQQKEMKQKAPTISMLIFRNTFIRTARRETDDLNAGNFPVSFQVYAGSLSIGMTLRDVIIRTNLSIYTTNHERSEKGKPSERMGRKVMGSKAVRP